MSEEADNNSLVELLKAYEADPMILRQQDEGAQVWLSKVLSLMDPDSHQYRNAAEAADGLVMHGFSSGMYQKLESRFLMALRQCAEQEKRSTSGKITQAPQGDSFWSDMHPEVIRVAKSRYEAEHYADAVESALKELNDQIKQHVLSKGGDEKDGAKLMRYAFSMSSPIIKLERLQTESERNIQQGYMDLFAGAMVGIRNPKAHSNITLSAKRCRHMLHLASLLFEVFEERIAEDES